MISDTRCVFAQVAGLVLAACVGRPAAAQAPHPVHVEFDFGISRLERRFPDPAKVEEAIARKIASLLGSPTYRDRFPWEFRAAVAGASHFPLLRVSLYEKPSRTVWLIRVDLFNANGGAVDSPPPEVLIEPGRLEVVETPPLAELPGIVVGKYAEKFLRQGGGTALQDRLKKIAPIGKGLVLARQGKPRRVDEADGLLLVKFSDFRMIARARYRVVCPFVNVNPPRAPVTLHSIGKGEAFSIPLAGGDRLDAILVHHESIGDPQQGLRPEDLELMANLKGGYFFLVSWEDPWGGVPPDELVIPIADLGGN